MTFLSWRSPTTARAPKPWGISRMKPSPGLPPLSPGGRGLGCGVLHEHNSPGWPQRVRREKRKVIGSGASCGPAGTVIQVVLEDDHCGYFIHLFPTFTPVEAQILQVLLGNKAGQPLIPEYDRQVQRFTELFGEASHLFALQAFAAAHMQRLADDNLVNLIFLRQTADRLNVGFQSLTTDRRPRLGRQHK